MNIGSINFLTEDNNAGDREPSSVSLAGLPEVILPGTQEDTYESEYEWATEEYLYDITQEYYQVIAKTEKTANEEKTTTYAYGLERIAAYTLQLIMNKGMIL